MAYTSYTFPPSTPLFPKASAVQEYLESYASHFGLRPHIRLRTSAQSIIWDARVHKWMVTTSEDPSAKEYDFVVVANGHYRTPFFPDVPGLKGWLDAKKAMHSAWYRRPHNLGRKVLVLGGGPSGNDISTEMKTVSDIVIQSVPGHPLEVNGKLKRLGRAVEFLEQGRVVFEDGTVESDIDFCILATGFQFDYPFLSTPYLVKDSPPPVPPLPSALYNSTRHVFPLAKHLFPLQDVYPPSSIAFMGLLIRVAPLPLAEAQAQAIIRVFADPDALNVTQEAVDIISRYEELGGHEHIVSEAWHKFEGREQFDYRDALCQFAGVSTRVSNWEIESYEKKDVLRRTWVMLEKQGKAHEWIDGVGSRGGIQEWVDLMRRLVKFAEEGNDETVARL